ncbi:hypothetical protein [Streptomyces antibioticus]|uniref:hypothetical protein n=2 Tax=Streptomyces antibioticus TaxID=1890 RepID=UPI00367C1CB4
MTTPDCQDYQVGDHVVFNDTEMRDLLRLTAPVTPTPGTITKVEYTVQREDGSTTTVSRSDFVTQPY